MQPPAVVESGPVPAPVHAVPRLGLGKRTRAQVPPPPAVPPSVGDTPTMAASTEPNTKRLRPDPVMAQLERQREQPGASPVSDFLDDIGPTKRYDTQAQQVTSTSTTNAVATAVALLGAQLARTARARGGSLGTAQTIESLTSTALITGPSEDEAVLIEAGPRPSSTRAGVIVVASPCCRGPAGCVSATHTWQGLPRGQMGPLLQAWLTPDEARKLEEGALQDDGRLAGRMCLLCLWHLLLQIHVYTDVSNVLRSMPSAVVPRCPRVGTDGRSTVGEDTYAPETLVVPPAGGSSPFAQPFPHISMSLIRFYRDARCGKWRVSLDAYRLVAPTPDFRTGAVAAEMK